MFCRGFLSLVFTIVAATTAFAQNKPLKIGEPLPESIWTTPLQVVNHPQKTITLAPDKNKLILLDFWATWCSSCLKNFPRMEELQKHFGDKIKVLTVSNQSRTVLENFFASKNGLRYKNVVSVTGDKIFHEMFPHTGVPFIVWIKDGKLLNTTDAEQVTEKTIAEVLGNQQSSLQTVVQIDKSKPLMLSDNFDIEKSSTLLAYSFISKGRMRSVSYGTWFHRQGSITYGRQFTNLSLLEIYSAIADELFSRSGDNFTPKRLINLIQHPEQIDFDTSTAGNEINDKLYNVDYILPKNLSDSLYKGMLKFINDNTTYDASIEKKLTKCLVLKRTSEKDKIATKGGEFIDSFLKTPSVLQNAPLEFMLSMLNANNKITALPVIDETGYKGKVDLQFTTVSDLKTLQKELSRYDLTLEETQRNLPMFVIKDKKHQL